MCKVHFRQSRAAFAALEESKVVSSYPFMVNPRRVIRVVALMSLLSMFLGAAVSLAQGQTFGLAPTQLFPATVDPGGSATSSINLTSIGGFTDPVNLTCAVTSNQVTTNLPQCKMSPTSATPPANGPSLTVTTTGTTPAGTYQITITGVSGSITQTATLFLNVANLTEDYTITVLPTTAIPSPVVAGSVATTVVTISPLGSYTGSITLACLSVTPVVTGAPVCSFDPSTVNVTTGAPPTSTLTITTFGTITTEKSSGLQIFYALWLVLPALALASVSAAGGRTTKLMGLFLLIAIASGLLLLPACSSSTTTTTSNQITPTDTYTFTLTGSDANGAGPSSITAATVTLQVN